MDVVIVGAAFISGIVSMMNRLDASEASKVQFERVMCAVQCLFWCVVHVWFAWRGAQSLALANESLVPFRTSRDLLRGVSKVPSLADPSRLVRVRRASKIAYGPPDGGTVRQLSIEDSKMHHH